MKAGVALLIATVAAASSAKAADSGFAGTWVNAEPAEGGVARVVVTPDAAPRLHVFGRCSAAECDWGVQPGHGFSDDPASDRLSSLTAEFDTGGAHKRVTLQRDVDGRIRFETLTIFTDGSGRRDFAARGLLAAPGTPPAAMTGEDEGGLFSGWGLGRAKPKSETGGDGGGLLSTLGFGSSKPESKPAASGDDDGGIFSGWGLGPAKPKPKPNPPPSGG